MKASKQENVSRQSSILKPPKQRQPLQCVATNSSSSENSPTIKVKRRVSFAKNRHIRQFCNEAEQETVWDNTCEEHDLSGTKNNSNNTNDQPIIIAVPLDDKENFPVQLFMQNDQIECREISTCVANENSDNLLPCDMEMDNSINNFGSSSVDLQNNEIEHPNATIYCDEGMDMTSLVPSSMINYQNQDSEYLDDTVLVSQTCVQDNSMSLTENLSINLNKQTIENQNLKKNCTINSVCNSTDLTQAISKLLGAGPLANSTKLLESQNVSNKENNGNKTNYLNTSLECTSVIPSFTWNKHNQNDERTENFTCKSMEFTMAVPGVNICKNQNLDRLVDLSEKTKIFMNKSMEMTEPVPICNNRTFQNADKLSLNIHDKNQEKTEIFLNKSMEMTEVVPVNNQIDKLIIHSETGLHDDILKKNKVPITLTEKIPIYKKLNLNEIAENQINDENMQEKTETTSNRSMELTEAISHYHNNDLFSIDTKKISSKETQESIKNCFNTSMEITEAVSNCNKIHERYIEKNKPLQKEMQEKTEIFSNKSMEITETISAYNKNDQPNEYYLISNCKALQEKTKIFSNESMELTEKVSSRDRIINDIETKDKTKIFNKTMEITESVVTINPIFKSNIGTIHNKIQPDKTEIFNDKSMEITNAIYSNNKNNHLNNEIQKTSHEFTKDKTKIFADTSMEMTEAVSNNKKINHYYIDTEKISHKQLQDKTKIFNNKSMEMTEVIFNCDKFNETNDAMKKISSDLLEEKTDVISNKLAESYLTNKNYDYATQVEKVLHEPVQNKTKVFTNTSMEITETIPIYKHIHEPNKTESQVLNEAAQEKTKIFVNKSMDISETIPICHKINKVNSDVSNFTSDEINGKTEVFNQSMDLTEAVQQKVSTIKELFQQNSNIEKVTNFYTNSMSITENFSVHQNIVSDIENHEKREINNIPEITNLQENPNVIADDKNKSMDITGIVSDLQTDKLFRIAKDIQNKTKIFLEKSINVTETIPIKNIQYVNETYQDISIKMNIEKDSLIQLKNNNENINSIGNIIETVSANCNSYNRSKTSQNSIEISSKFEVNKPIDFNDKYLNNQPHCSLNKSFDNISDKFNSAPLVLTHESNIKNLSQYQNEDILSNKIGIVHDSMNISDNFNKGNNYEMTDRFSTREETFHRITSDELNTLCASMNLPTQKYTKDQSATLQNNYISSYNDVNPLCNSLKNNAMFQQPVNQNNISLLHVPIKACENFNKINCSKELSEINLENLNNNVQNSIEKQNESINNIPMTMDFSKQHKNSMDISSTVQTNPNIFSNTRYTSNNPKVALSTTMKIENNESDIEFPVQKQTTCNLLKGLSNTIENSKYLNTSKNERDFMNYISHSHKSQETDDIIQNCENPHIFGIKKQNFKMSSNEITDLQNDVKCSSDNNDFIKDTAIRHKNIDASDENSKILHNATNNTNLDENKITQNSCSDTVHEKLPNNLQTHYNVSMEYATMPSTTKRKSTEMTESYSNKKMFTSNTISSIENFNNINNDKIDKDENNTKKNSLSRMPSDSTEVLLATMGFKTELSHPLIINDKTVIKISRKSLANKTYTIGVDSNVESQIDSNKTYVIDKNVNKNNKIEPLITANNQIESEKTDLIETAESSKNIFKRNDANNYVLVEENKESIEHANSFTEELEEIQPPSFLCSDSIQDDSIEHIEKLDSGNSSLVSHNSKEKNMNSIPENELNELKINSLISENCKNAKVVNIENNQELLQKETKKNSDIESNFAIQETQKQDNKTLSSKNNQIVISENKGNIIKEPFNPLLSLIDEIKKYENRDSCIWTIRIIKPTMFAVDYITKSFIVVIRLNENERNALRNIVKVEFISRLRTDSKNILLKIVHNLLLLKLKPEEILIKYKLYEDVLPLLEYISNEVIFAMNFMFDLQRLNALNLLNIESERILFIIASKKANIILKVSVMIKILNEIGPDDVNVTCILGKIRKNDIKQLIVNIKRDYKFLSRYMNDVKDYITLMEESMCLKKH